MLRTLGIWLRVEQGEGSKVTLLALNLGLACALLMLLRTLTTVLFLDSYEVSLLPWLFAAQALFFTLLSLAQGALLGRISRGLEIGGLMLLFLSTLLLGRVFLELQWPWLVFVLYVLVQSFAELLLIEVSILQTSSFNPREARRLQPLVNAGGTLGAVAGGILAALLPAWIGMENLLQLGMGLIALAWFSSLQVARKHALPIQPQAKAAQRIGAIAPGLLGVFRNRLMGLFVLLVFALFVASTLVDFQFKTLLKMNFSKAEMAEFLGFFFALLNLLTLLVQLFISSRFLLWFGLLGGLLAMPLVLLLGSLVFWWLPLLWVVSIMRFSELLTSYSLYKDASSLLYMPFSAIEQGRLNLFTRGMVRPLGVLMASLILILLADQVALAGLSVLIMLCAAVALLAAFGLRRPYIEQLSHSLSNRRIRLMAQERPGATAGRELARLIEAKLASDDPSSLGFALELIRAQPKGVRTQPLLRLLHHADAKVRQEAMETLSQLKPADATGGLLTFLTASADGEDRARGLALLGQLNPEAASQLARQWVEESDWRVRGTALALVARFDQRGLQVISADLQASQANRLAAALLAGGELGLSPVLDILPDALRHPQESVRKAAIQAAMKLRVAEALPILVQALTEDRLAPLIRPALLRQGRRAVPLLIDAWWQAAGNARKRRAVVSVLRRLPFDEARLALLNGFAQTQDYTRYLALNALSREERPEHASGQWSKRLQQVMHAELNWGLQEQDLLRQALALESSIYAAPDRRSYLLGSLRDRLERRRRNLLQLLVVLGPRQAMRRAWYNFVAKDPRLRANSLELIDNLLNSRTMAPVVAFLEAPEPLADDTGAHAQRLIQACARIDHWLAEEASFALGQNLLNNGAPQMNQAQLTQVQRVFLLKSTALFSTLSSEDLRPLAEVCEEMALPAGSQVFAQGDASDQLYMIVEGQVAVLRNQRQINVLESGSAFGEMSLLDKEPRSATLQTLTDTLLLSIDQETFQEVLEEYPEVSLTIMQVLSQRLRDTLHLSD